MSIWAYFKNLPTLTKNLLIFYHKKIVYIYYIGMFAKLIHFLASISSFWLISWTDSTERG